MRSQLWLGVLVAVALSVSAGAEGCVPTTSDPEITTCAGPLADNECDYIDNDPCQLECILSVWWYFEANGIEGLQRSDEGKDDTCGGTIASDLIRGT